MIPEPIIREARRLVGLGLSQRAVARIVKISRAVVGQIERGERPDYDDLRCKREGGRDFNVGTGPVRRCAGCGHLVHMPCHECRVKAVATRGRRSDGDGLSLSLELSSEDLDRYRRIAATRRPDQRTALNGVPQQGRVTRVRQIREAVRDFYESEADHAA